MNLTENRSNAFPLGMDVSDYGAVSSASNEPSGGTLEIGTVLDEKCVILKFIGNGGMGEVYRAHQLNLDRDVAIKIVSPRHLQELNENEYEAESCIERFRREVKMMAQVRHPNVIQIHDFCTTTITNGSGNNLVEYIVMEYIPGSSLRSTMSAEGFYPDEARTTEWLRTYFMPVLDGAQALHDLGIVHRDLKPENVLLDGATPKVTDFGLARSCRIEPLTQSMDIKGTPPYMSPEHFLDLKRTDERADVYSLGKILYEAVRGKIPQEQIPFQKACLPVAETPFFQELDRIMQKATDGDKNLRFPSAGALGEAVKAVIEDADKTSPVLAEIQPEKPRRWKSQLITAAITLMRGILVATITFALLHQNPGQILGSHALFSGSFQGQATEKRAMTRHAAVLSAPTLPALKTADGDNMLPTSTVGIAVTKGLRRNGNGHWDLDVRDCHPKMAPGVGTGGL